MQPFGKIKSSEEGNKLQSDSKSAVRTGGRPPRGSWRLRAACATETPVTSKKN